MPISPAAGSVRPKRRIKDALTIYSNQPQVVLKLALVQIALGKNDEAVDFLDAGRSVLDRADYGLALALAGHPADAIAVLEPAARQTGADATVRQNLALAYAFRATGPTPGPSPPKIFPQASSTRASNSGCSSPSPHKRRTRSQRWSE